MWPEERTEAARGDKVRVRAVPELSKIPVPGSRQIGSSFLGVILALNVCGHSEYHEPFADGALIRPFSLHGFLDSPKKQVGLKVGCMCVGFLW